MKRAQGRVQGLGWRAQVKAQHYSAQTRVCEGTAAVTERQKRLMRKLSSIFLDAALPADITFEKAEAWIEQHSAKWMELPAPPKLTPGEFMESTQAVRR